MRFGRKKQGHPPELGLAPPRAVDDAGSDVGIAVVDVETTGLHPGYHHRVVEVAVVTIAPDGQRSEWSTLINPGRDLGPQAIHGIRGIDLIEAPTFGEIVGDLMALLDQRAIVAHNASFDQIFIEAELQRVGIQPPGITWHCTMQLARRLGWPASLASCCTDLGITGATHCALDDARACADVLNHATAALGGSLGFTATTWPAAPRSGRTCVRGAGARRPAPSALALMARSASDDGDEPHPAYSQLLAQAMEDRVLTPHERGALQAMAQTLGLDAEEQAAAHRRWLGRLLALAQRDGTVTERERADLSLAASTLEIDLDDALSVRDDDRPEGLPQGTVVCFTGALGCIHDGAILTRERARALAEQAGLVVVANVSKKCDVLVLADPHSQSGKAKRARELGVRLIAEPAFWPMIDITVR